MSSALLDAENDESNAYDDRTPAKTCLSSQRSEDRTGNIPPQSSSKSNMEASTSDEDKSKEELMDELKRMREQMKLLQSPPPSGQMPTPPRETFSDAIQSPLMTTPHVVKKKPSDIEASSGKRVKPCHADAIADSVGFPSLSNPENDDWNDEHYMSEVNASDGECNQELFKKNHQRVAHTPKSQGAKPDKVSPYKCELCHESLDTMDSYQIHMFTHRREAIHQCTSCDKSFPSKLKLTSHARIHDVGGADSSSRLTSGRERKMRGTRLTLGNGKRSDEIVETNRHSQIRIVNPLVSSSRLEGLMSGRKMIRISVLEQYQRSGPLTGDWVTLGVVVTKITPKKSSKGKMFSIWKLSDLSVVEQLVTLFLFGKSHDEHGKLAVGSVVGVLNANVMPPKENHQDDGMSISIDHPQKLLLIGTSKDFGHCRSQRKDGKQCTMVVNKSVGDFCQFHVQGEYKKKCTKRTDLQSSYSGVQPNVFKRKMANNVIYGGHSFNPVSASVVDGKAGKVNPTKLRFKHKKAALQSLGVKGVSEIEQEARDSILTLHGRNNKQDTLIQVTGASHQFKDMLSAPCSGSQNLIRHMVKVEEVSKTVSTITAKDLLKQHQLSMKAKRAARIRNPASHNGLDTASSSTCPSNNPAKPELDDTENCIPVLGRGLKEGESITFDSFGPPPPPLAPRNNYKNSSAEKAKKRAISLVRAKGPIDQIDPNKVVGSVRDPISPRKRDAVKRRVEEDLSRSQEDDSSDAESSPRQPSTKKHKRSFLGQDIDLSEQELKAIVNAKSSHSGLLAEVQAEMEEIYFKALEKKERLENQMDSIKEKKCSVVSCKICDYTWFSASDLCKQSNHTLARHTAMLRYFTCKGCKSRTITFNRIPNKSCRSCGGTSYDRATMLRERKGPILESERLLIRGEERTWVM